MTRTAAPLLACLLALGALAASAPRASAQAGDPKLEPLRLDGTRSLDFPARPAFDFESGTLELWLVPGWQEDPGYFPCVLANRAEPASDDADALAAATRYSVHVTGARDAIGLFDGRRFRSVPFDFGDGRYHHVALVTEGGRTEVFVDGASRGVIELGYGSGRGLPLHIGSSDGSSEPFVGGLWAVRLWSRAIDEQTLAQLAGVYGPPDPAHPAAGSLVAFSVFSEDAQDLFIPAPLATSRGADEQAASESPLALDGSFSLDFPPDPGLDFESGTIEFMLAALWEDDPGYFPCVIALRDDAGADGPEALARATRFSVHLTGAKDEIGLWNGRRWGSVPFDFGDGRYHHVALVTEGGRTEVFVDGASRGVMELGYGEGRDLPLHLGTSDGESEPFLGGLLGVRLWNAPLEPGALAELVTIEGPPEEHEASASLVAFSAFSAESPDFYTIAPADE